ncbi:cell division protein FtsL [Parvularcula maris]|uniref:Cell division protein FtsL n=1 Tax=Parvularcula maris TaxID=2965077 RepID=A0A9X2L8K8_9PROT|nr:cell division protein FtsL [Parvularcula maris]MCQ8185076.1 cell division protein FtsL [Parvularcula maris]
MIRFAIFAVLSLALAGSAIMRLSAEHQVREERRAIARLDRQEKQLQAEIDRLRFEVEVLESAPRLGELSADRLSLAPGSGEQMADGDVLRGVIDPAPRVETQP